MKKVYLLLLCLLASYSVSAQKVTFRLQAAGNAPVIADVTKDVVFESSSLSSYYQIPQQERAVIKTSFKEKPGGRIGSTVAVNVSPKLALETGLLATLVRYQISTKIDIQENPVTTTEPSPDTPPFPSGDNYVRDKDGNLIYDANGEPIRMRYPYSGSNSDVLRRWGDPMDSQTNTTLPEPYPKAGNTTMLYLDIPLQIRYNLYNFLDIKAGYTTSLLVYSERYLYFSNYDIQYMEAASSPTWTHSDAFGRHGKVKNGGGFSKVLFALNAGVTLKATKHFGLDIDYARYLTPIYTAQANQDKHVYNLFSAGTSFTF